MNTEAFKNLKKKFGNQLKEIKIDIDPQIEKDVKDFIQILNKAQESVKNSKIIFK